MHFAGSQNPPSLGFTGWGTSWARPPPPSPSRSPDSSCLLGGGGFPLGSLGRCARMPGLFPRFEGGPTSPHGHWLLCSGIVRVSSSVLTPQSGGLSPSACSFLPSWLAASLRSFVSCSPLGRLTVCSSPTGSARATAPRVLVRVEASLGVMVAVLELAGSSVSLVLCFFPRLVRIFLRIFRACRSK